MNPIPRHTAGEPTMGPQRTCFGCKSVDAQADLLRFTAVGKHLRRDGSRRMPGRGAYVHPEKSCMNQAAKSGFRRSFRRDLSRESIREQLMKLNGEGSNE